MTDHPPDHGPFEELAAGYALDALEPADEQRFLRHARQCPACAEALADFREVAAALADTAPPAEPRPQLADRIMAAALADFDAGHRPGAPPADSASPANPPLPAAIGAAPRTPDRAAPGDPDTAPGTARRDTEVAREDAVTVRENAVAAREDAVTAREDASARPGEGAAAPGDALPPGVVPLRPRARRWQKPASVAAAAALIAGGGIWAGLAATTSGPQPPPATCAHPNACPQVTLIAKATHRAAATVMIRNGVAWMAPAKMGANPASDIYVLWQITGSHRPFAVGSFDVRPGAHAPIKIGALPASYRGTLAFAVSLEHGRTIPAGPSRVVALGQVS